MPQKPVLDLQPIEEDEELDLQPLDLQPVPDAPPEKGLLGKGWDLISTPLTDAPSRWARDIATTMTDPNNSLFGMQETGKGGVHDYVANTLAKLRGFEAGALEGAGDLVSGLTSPINLATTALTAGQGTAAKAGLPAIAKAMSYGGKVAGGLTAAHGASNVLDPNSTLADRAMGGVELAGGMLGMRGNLPKIGQTAAREMPADLAVPTRAAETVSPNAPKIGQKVTLRQATPEIIKKAKEQGWVFDSLTDDGKFKIRYEGTPGQQPILEGEVGTHRPRLGPAADVKKSNPVVEAANFPRAVMASVDMSAPLRQGLPLIHKSGFWKAIPAMVKSWGSEEAFNAVQQSIADKPLFKPRVGPGGTTLPSFADDAGLKLTDLTDLSSREEAVMSTWAEKIPGVRRSNRAYTAFLNKLRADTFENLVRDGKVFGADGETNLPLARSLADFVNYSSGRGSLGKAERAAVILNSTFFAPRLIASRVKILNPYTYINPKTDAFTRKEAIKSLLALAGAGNAMVGLAKMSGAEVENDPASSDFGKIKIGNVRLDPWAGAQQYIVAANRILRPREARIESMEGGSDTGIAPIDMATGFAGSPGGKFKSSVSGREYFLGEKYGGSSRLDVAGRFLEGKANPIINFATGLLRGKDLAGQPFNVPDEVAKRFVPIFVQDVIELASENPELLPGIADIIGGNIHPENLPAAAPSFFGMGMQRYGDN
jgi:hypothetical protein